MDLNERSARLDAIIEGLSVDLNLPLVKRFDCAGHWHQRIVDACNVYLWSSLNSYFSGKAFTLASDMLQAYPEDLMALPNITPNGLVLPKQQNLFAYNLLHWAVAGALEEMAFYKHFKALQFPINIRLVNGKPDPALDARPRASTKWHMDLWAGDPPASFVMALPVLGNFDAGIRFAHTEDCPPSLFKVLDDYDLGQPAMENAEVSSQAFKEKKWIFFDAYALHQTVKPGDGARLSLEFRVIPHGSLPSDTIGGEHSSRIFVDPDEWKAVGRSKFLSTEENIENYTGDTDRPTQSYEVSFSIADLNMLPRSS
jgi:hypothetical protein